MILCVKACYRFRGGNNAAGYALNLGEFAKFQVWKVIGFGRFSGLAILGQFGDRQCGHAQNQRDHDDAVRPAGVKA